jgi:spore coat polysaccharide biosynthesis protein SpsF
MGRSAIAVGIIIQARMGSTRLPGKVLMNIAGRPLLRHILDRLRHLRYPARVLVATGDSVRDDPIAEWCAARHAECFRGSEHDVLKRYFDCAHAMGFEQIVRLTGDNPFTDIDELDRLVEMQIRDGFDYSSSLDVLPVGVGAEIFTFEALRRSERDGLAPHHREHVDEYILENPGLFRLGRLVVAESKRVPQVRLTVDTAEDLRRAQYVAEHASSDEPATEEAIALCSRFA